MSQASVQLTSTNEQNPLSQQQQQQESINTPVDSDVNSRSPNLPPLDLLTVLAFSSSKVEARKGQALQLLRFILDDIVKLPENEIDRILKGPVSEHIVNMHVETQNILEQDSNSTVTNGDEAMKLEKVISDHITKMQFKSRSIIRGPAAKDTHPNEALFTAAEMGNTIFLVELIRRYPDILWKVNDSNQTIFHIAVENRHEDIYNMLYEIGYMKDWITSLEDENGNNMLHLVAKIAKKKKLEEVPGVVYQMQRELFWFKEVRKMIHSSCRGRKNKDGLTPQELFTKEHEDLLAQSVKWVKGTANQCMVVATLVVAITFAAAITVPGGYNQTTGIPIFFREESYKSYILYVAMSLLASSMSILLFITIHTSRFAERDFLKSIPVKFTAFLAVLIVSIYFLIISFISNFSVLYHKDMVWILKIIYVVAYLVMAYVLLQYACVLRQLAGPLFLFNTKKHVLYYQNPVV